MRKKSREEPRLVLHQASTTAFLIFILTKDAISGLFEALVQKKRFRLTAFRLFEAIMGDISLTRLEQEKLEREDREEKKKEATVEEDDDVKEEKPEAPKQVDFRSFLSLDQKQETPPTPNSK